jgi:RNA recognition motif-containing protein
MDYGVVDVSLVMDRDTGTSKGFAFVTLEDEDAAADAMEEMDGAQINGNPINVNEARERRRFQNRQYNTHNNGGGTNLQQAIYEAQGALRRLSDMLNKQPNGGRGFKKPQRREHYFNQD